MSLSDLSNQEINVRVAKVKFPNCINRRIKMTAAGVMSIAFDGDGEPLEVYRNDWINDDALAFRLMVDNKIVLHKSEAGDYHAHSDVAIEWIDHYEGWCFEWKYEVACKNPNRAIAECFLLMNGVES